MLRFMAHAQESHQTTTDGLAHYFESLATTILVWLILNALFWLISRNVFKISQANSLFIIAGLNLVFGFAIYTVQPQLAALIVSIGFAVTLATVLIGINENPSQKKESKNGKRRTK